MKLYTKTGDDGTTGLFGGARVPKASARVTAYGTVDETNAAIGAASRRPARAGRRHDDRPTVLPALVQRDLFVLGAELACVPGKEAKLGMTLLGPADIERLEHAIDDAEAACPPLKHFILPGGSPWPPPCTWREPCPGAPSAASSRQTTHRHAQRWSSTSIA